MAAITTTVASPQAFVIVRNVSGQATTGQTDFVLVPQWAKYATVVDNLTTITGTSHTIALQVVDPVLLDDGEVMNVAEHAAWTAATGQRMLVVQVGPGVTGIADDTTASATADSYASLNAVLPSILGIKVTNVVGGGAFTYALTVKFRGA